jgi:signal transduction histidine kinase
MLLDDRSGVRLIVVVRDVTELRLAERRLEESERKLRSVFDNSCDGIIVLTPSFGEPDSFIISDINRQALQLCGIEYGDGVGSPVDAVLPQMKKSGLLDSVRAVFASGNAVEYEDVRCPSIGKNIILQVSIFSAGDHVVLTMKNVVEKVRTTIELKEQAAILEEKNSELERFIYHISHDLRSPITILQGMISVLVEDYQDALGKEGNYYLSRIATNVGRLDAYIRDLLKLSRADRGIYPLEVVDTYSLVHELVNALLITYSGSSATIGNLPRVRYERELLRELFSALIENAFMYSASVDSPHIEVTCHEQGNEFLFSVKDNGIGIEPQYTNKIFKVFERLCDVDTPGTGIGLALAERIVSIHNGSLWVESTKGEGSTFSFTIQKEEEDMHGI